MNTEKDRLPLPPDIDDALVDIGLTRVGEALPDDSEDKRRTRARAFYRRDESGFAQLSLVRGGDGVLRWQEGVVRTQYPGGRRAARAAIPAGKVERQYIYEKLHDPNQIAAAVEKLDNVLTNPDKRDLYRLNGRNRFDKKVAPDVPGQFAGKDILLFIHGTFSHCDGLCEQIRGAQAGSKDRFGSRFLTDARSRYDHVLAFNHPTLAVSPVVNAFRLASLLRDSKGQPKSIDVVCHSRGGLVARWWLEGFAAPETTYRVMFVASPLGGTSLASPARLKSGMDLLSNVSSALGKGAALTGVPLIQVAGGVLKVIGSVTKLVAKTPALDAAVAVIPGLMGQARVSTNFEIRNLRASGGWQSRRQGYFAIRSDFAPPEEDKWKFWRVFCRPKEVLMGWADKAADDLVFVARSTEGGPLEPVANDLVVDCPSMGELGESRNEVVRIDDTYDFLPTKRVHHTNYFEQRETLDFIRAKFGIPLG